MRDWSVWRAVSQVRRNDAPREAAVLGELAQGTVAGAEEGGVFWGGRAEGCGEAVAAGLRAGAAEVLVERGGTEDVEVGELWRVVQVARAVFGQLPPAVIKAREDACEYGELGVIGDELSRDAAMAHDEAHEDERERDGERIERGAAVIAGGKGEHGGEERHGAPENDVMRLTAGGRAGGKGGFAGGEIKLLLHGKFLSWSRRFVRDRTRAGEVCRNPRTIP